MFMNFPIYLKESKIKFNIYDFIQKDFILFSYILPIPSLFLEKIENHFRLTWEVVQPINLSMKSSSNSRTETSIITFESLNVLDYGVVADGTTNNSTNLQVAIDDASAQQKPLYFPPSESYYRVDSQIIFKK
jgi:polygalacturonase